MEGSKVSIDSDVNVQMLGGYLEPAVFEVSCDLGTTFGFGCQMAHLPASMPASLL